MTRMTEKQVYELVQTYPDFELRRYPSHVVAEVVVRAPFADAGNAAFRTLAGYIGGQNRSAGKIAMTAPVVQRDAEPIAMTAPVLQTQGDGEGEYAVSFVLPSTYTLETAPVPTDPAVRLHEHPTTLSAARRYRGRWTQASFEHHWALLVDAVRGAGLTPVGPPRWARFDPPIVPAPLRRNEVVQDLAEDG